MTQGLVKLVYNMLHNILYNTFLLHNTFFRYVPCYVT
jgi:hypothetical protein